MGKDFELQSCWKSFFEFSEKMHKLAQLPEHAEENMETKVTIALAKVLSVLCARAPESVLLKDLVRELKVTSGALTQTIDQLVDYGMVLRCEVPGDRRKVCLKLTETADRLRLSHENFCNRLMADFLAEIPEEEQLIFLRVLNRIMERLNKEYHQKDEVFQ